MRRFNWQYSVLSLTIITLSSNDLFAGTIRGRVCDSETHEPLPGANVVLMGTKFGAAADLDGRYKIQGLPSGIYSIGVSYIGYLSVEVISVDVRASGGFGRNIVVEVNFYMPSSAIEVSKIVSTYKKGVSNYGGNVPDEQELKSKITWVRPQDYRIEIEAETARISAIITSESEIEEIKILVNGVDVYRNGKPVNTDFRGATSVTQTRRHSINNFIEFTVDAEVKLHPLEESEITIYAKNASIGVTSEKRIIYYKVPQYDLYLLSIGISDYKNKDLNLKFADDDAQAISDIFRTQRGKLFNNIFVKQLYNAQATRMNIQEGLKWLENKKNPKDVTLLFIAAHGKVDYKGSFYIVPYDGSLYEVSQGITWDSIAKTLKKGVRILFLDVCYSGMVEYVTRGGSDINEAIKSIAAAEDTTIIFTATTGMGFSQERSEWGHGAFTKAVIAGLKEGKADYLNSGVIYLPELYTFVTTHVMELTQGQQKPEMKNALFLPIYQWK